MIIFTSLDISGNGIKIDGISSKLFMGFGYNPNLIKFGERLDILNFYSWMKKLQDTFLSKWFIYDASGYYIVNKIPKKKIERLGKEPLAKQILEVIVEEQERSKRQEIMENCDLRSQYLQRAIDISRINAKYIDSRQVFREEKEYQLALDESLEFIEKLQKDNSKLIEKILLNNPNPASKFYLPLEIAEALYLESKFGARGKFGPEKEEFFDKVILKLTKEKEIPYQSIRCSSGPRKPGYLSDRNVIWTNSPDYFIPSILQSDKEYKKFVKQYLKPFKQNGELIEQTALKTKQQLKLRGVI